MGSRPLDMCSDRVQTQQHSIILKTEYLTERGVSCESEGVMRE